MHSYTFHSDMNMHLALPAGFPQDESLAQHERAAGLYSTSGDAESAMHDKLVGAGRQLLQTSATPRTDFDRSPYVVSPATHKHLQQGLYKD